MNNAKTVLNRLRELKREPKSIRNFERIKKRMDEQELVVMYVKTHNDVWANEMTDIHGWSDDVKSENLSVLHNILDVRIEEVAKDLTSTCFNLNEIEDTSEGVVKLFERRKQHVRNRLHEWLLADNITFEDIFESFNVEINT